MRPGTIINWYDQSEQSTVADIQSYDSYPLFLAAFSADRGPEDMRVVKGQDFFKLYGSDILFEKHGQPLLQAANIANNGGRLLVKRVVAEDAKLANLAVVAKVKTVQVQKVDADGKPLYEDNNTHAETTVAEGNTAIMINTASVTYETYSASDVTTLKDAYDACITKLDDTGTEEGEDENKTTVYTYPLFIVADNGRGVSTKRFNITPDYTVSKGLAFQLYNFNNIGSVDLDSEYVRFTLDQDIIYLGTSMSLEMTTGNMTQIEAKGFDSSISKFIERIAAITGVDKAELAGVDLLFGKDRRGVGLSYMSVDAEGVALNSAAGLTLVNGSNGTFTDKPFGTEDYNKQLLAFFKGEFDDSIYDVDRYQIYACCDANYPEKVKDAISDLADFREDFFFFRDYGTTAKTYYEIMNYRGKDAKRTKFSADYHIFGDIIDPYTKKQITVTCMYDIAALLVAHIRDRATVPFCGIANNAILTSFIDNTVNFCPKYLPTVDQKTEFDDAKINYANYFSGDLVLETEYTSQDKNTQLSYINNILNIQQVIRAIRTACPRFRYSFITNTDLESYKKNVNEVLAPFKSNFASIEFDYTQDPIMAANKVFTASLYVTFKDFAQTEIFNIYILNAAQ